MKPTLIDTDILSLFFRNNLKVIENANAYLKEYNTLNFSIITYYEVLNGLLYKDAKNQLKKFKEFVAINTVVPLTIEAADIAAEIYATLKIKGQPIGHTDSLIAGISLAHGLQLVTNNTDHFNRIERLEVLNWQQ